MKNVLTCSVASFAALVLLSTASAQAGAPAKRAHHALAYDDSRQRVLLAHGSTPADGGKRFEFFDDLWALEDSVWTPLAPSGEMLSGCALAFDGRRQRMLSFGGYDGRESLADLRLLENDAFHTIGQHPKLRAAEPGFVYDTLRERFVLFGGSAGRGQAHGDTWEYDGTNWTQLTIAGPAPRQAHVMVFDARRGHIIVFGGMGQGAPGPMLGDTWDFDGASWRKMTAQGPSPRHGAGAAYDARRGVVILFGGMDASGFQGDTWSWDGGTWKRLADTGPPPRAMGYLAYDKRGDRIILFGGRMGYPDGDLNDTWEWNGARWRRLSG